MRPSKKSLYFLLQVLENRVRAAHLLGINRNTLRKKIKELRIRAVQR